MKFYKNLIDKSALFKTINLPSLLKLYIELEEERKFDQNKTKQISIHTNHGNDIKAPHYENIFFIY